jgi:hypothetical protein
MEGAAIWLVVDSIATDVDRTVDVIIGVQRRV